MDILVTNPKRPPIQLGDIIAVNGEPYLVCGLDGKEQSFTLVNIATGITYYKSYPSMLELISSLNEGPYKYEHYSQEQYQFELKAKEIK